MTKGFKQPNRKIWQGWEIDLLSHFYHNHSAELLGRVLGRSEKSIYMAAKKWGFKKDPAFAAETTRRRWQQGKHENSRKCQFYKNHKPWNKGMKGLHIGGKETRFKPGNTPPNTRFDGAISIRKDRSGISYKYVRVKKAHWVPLHRLTWEQHHGPIPAKHVVIFKDGNWQNCNIENLECISMQENMERNSVHRFPQDIKDVVRARAVLTRTINSISKSKTD